MKKYRYYQPNEKDLKDSCGDCVVRSFTKVTGKTWLQVFDELTDIARQMQCMPNDKSCYVEFLKQNGFVYTGVSNKKGSRRPRVKEFSEEGKYVLVVANHLVASIDGCFYDTWDSGDCCLYGYWRRKKNAD